MIRRAALRALTTVAVTVPAILGANDDNPFRWMEPGVLRVDFQHVRERQVLRPSTDHG
ncbi:hypothetical protein [Streptomyces abikoensis]|uniref:hypothetical protein n=1 Tax=Streptomyces abikoensis TaxID=97398 RepID=UPI00368F7185